jgi:uncharacterized protein
MASDGPPRLPGGRAFLDRAAQGKVLLGMVHLPPLPGSPGHQGSPLEEVLASARRDAEALLDGGMDGYLIENFGDTPFFAERVPPHVLTVLVRIALALPHPPGRSPPALRGVNVLRNDAQGALAVAFAAGLDLIRVNVHAGAMVTDQGLIEGRAAETLRLRALLGAEVAILADVLVKHAAPLGSGAALDPGALARDLVERAGADGLIVTGAATGAAADSGRLKAVRAAAAGRPVLVGSGVTPRTVAKLLELADGAIVGTSLKEDGEVRAPVDPKRVRELVRAARKG